MKDRDIRLIQYIEADLASVNRALSELGTIAATWTSAELQNTATCALQAMRHKLRQELMQALFDEYAQGVELASGVIILKPRNGRD